MSGQSSSPCWWVKDDSTSTFWHAAGVLNSMRYSHLLGSVTCTNSFVEPHRRFTYTSNTKQRFNPVSGWQCNFSLDLCTLIRTNEKQGDETRPWKLHRRQWSILGSRSHFVTGHGARMRICWALMWTLTFLKYPRYNSGTVPVREFKVLRHKHDHQWPVSQKTRKLFGPEGKFQKQNLLNNTTVPSPQTNQNCFVYW